jgi:hypothetical protein
MSIKKSLALADLNKPNICHQMALNIHYLCIYSLFRNNPLGSQSPSPFLEEEFRVRAMCLGDWGTSFNYFLAQNSSENIQGFMMS